MPWGRGPDGLAVAGAWLAATGVVLVPLLLLARTVLVEGVAAPGDLVGPGLWTATRHSLALAAAVTLAALGVGTALALVLRRPDLPGRTLWRAAVVLPVLIPDFVLAYSWRRAYGRAGFTDQLLGLSWAGIEGPVGIWVVLAVNATPLAYLVVAVGLSTRAESVAERAARAAGAAPPRVLWTITLPLLRPALASAAVLIFVLTLGAFAIPQVLGSPAGFATVTTRVYANLAQGSDPAAFTEAVAAALLLAALTLVLAVPADLVLGPRLRATRNAISEPLEAPRSGTLRRTRSRSWGAPVLLGGYLLAGTGLPLIGLAATALTRAVGLTPVPSNWTVGHFAAIATERNAEALGRSLVLATVAATVVLVLGGVVALGERTRTGRGLAPLIAVTLVLPGTTVAIGLLLSYGRWLADTAAIIELAYVAKLWAVAHRPISGAADRLPPDERHAARASGAGRLTAAATVVLPPLAPALLAAWLVCFLTALHEVTMSSLLYGPGQETLAVVVLNSAELGRLGVTAALAVALTVVVLVPAIGLGLLGRPLRRWAHAR